MSLLVWLPLNGNLENKGLSDATFSAYASDIYLSVANDGKISPQCYQRTAAAGNGFRSSKTFKLDGDVSMCCWAYISDAPETSANGLITNHNHKDGSGFGITVKRQDENDFRISCNEGRSGSDRTYHTYYGTTNIKDAWHHLALTHNQAKKELKLYVDGVCEKTVSGKNFAVGDNPFDLFVWSTGYIHSLDYHAIGKLNDVRLYDNCLSEKELSEIAKGMVAHYKLNGSGGKNLITQMRAGRSMTNINKYSLLADYSANTDTYAWFDVSPELDPAKIYTLSFDVTNFPGEEGEAWTWNLYNNSNYAIWVDHDGHYVYTFTPNPDGPHTGFLFDDGGRPAPKGKVTFSNFKIEEGEFESPWYPHQTDSLYSILFNNTEYDCSGYEHHASYYGTPVFSGDSPIGASSMTFTGSNAVVCGRGPMVTDELTVNLWVYMSDWSKLSNSYRIMSCTEGGGWNFENVGHFIVYAGGAYIRASGTLTSLPSGWHMLTGTWDGYQSKIYADGILKASSSALASKTKISYNNNNGIFIGVEAGGSATTPGSPYFTGKISDVRIYGKALSEQDIKELYQVPISISNKGEVLAKQLMEV